MRTRPDSNRLVGSAALGLALFAVSCGDGQPDPDRAEGRKPPGAAAGDAPGAPEVAPAEPPVASAPPAEPAPPTVPASAGADAGPLVAGNGASIANLVVARGVEKRQPVEPGTSFAAPGPIRLYAIFDVMNPARGAGELAVSWLAPDGKERGKAALSYPEQPKWRTWAFHSHVRQPGRWEAIVRTADGAELGRAPFEVTP